MLVKIVKIEILVKIVKLEILVKIVRITVVVNWMLPLLIHVPLYQALRRADQ